MRPRTEPKTVEMFVQKDGIIRNWESLERPVDWCLLRSNAKFCVGASTTVFLSIVSVS